MPVASAAPVTGANGANGSSQRLSKNAKRRAKKKQEKVEDATTTAKAEGATTAIKAEEEEDVKPQSLPLESKPAVAGPSISDLSIFAQDDETFAQFKDVFAHFQSAEEDEVSRAGPSKGDIIYSDDEVPSDSEASDLDGNQDAKGFKELSKRKQKKLSRLTVAELKQMVRKPEVVDWSDVTATDPKLLVSMKSTRNTVPVPPHWSQKRDYLQNKRGIEKPPYELPPYIAATGIGSMRDALSEKESDQTLKAKTRERVQPKMNKLTVDYQKLHDAFFRFQTKPPLTAYGETYYEGKEYETKSFDRKPGDLSSELKEALSIPPLAPPPWLIAMQRYGPPPSYPHLKIPGLNAPIPDGAQWGFHPGGWGRPPMDEFGNPIYSDVLGASGQDPTQSKLLEEPVLREPFGELDPEESEEELDESEEEEEEAGDGEEAEDEEQRMPADGLETPSGLASVASTIPAGLETPQFMDLRKRDAGVPPVDPRPDQGQRSLYQVLPETQGSMQGFMASERGYDLSSASAASGPVLGADASEPRGTKRRGGGAGEVQISFDPSELEGMSEAELRERYESARGDSSGVHVPGGGGSSAELSMLREELSRKRRANEERKRDRGAERREKEKEEKFKF